MLKLTITALLLGGAFIFTVGFVKVVHTFDGSDSAKTEKQEEGSITLTRKERKIMNEYYDKRTSSSQTFKEWHESGACSSCK